MYCLILYDQSVTWILLFPLSGFSPCFSSRILFFEFCVTTFLFSLLPAAFATFLPINRLLDWRFNFRFIKGNHDVNMIPFRCFLCTFVSYFISFDSYMRRYIILSPIIWILCTVMFAAFPLKHLVFPLICYYFKLINEELDSEHITYQRSHLFNPL